MRSTPSCSTMYRPSSSMRELSDSMQRKIHLLPTAVRRLAVEEEVIRGTFRRAQAAMSTRVQELLTAPRTAVQPWSMSRSTAAREVSGRLWSSSLRTWRGRPPTPPSALASSTARRTALSCPCPEGALVPESGPTTPTMIAAGAGRGSAAAVTGGAAGSGGAAEPAARAEKRTAQ